MGWWIRRPNYLEGYKRGNGKTKPVYIGRGKVRCRNQQIKSANQRGFPIKLKSERIPIYYL